MQNDKGKANKTIILKACLYYSILQTTHRNQLMNLIKQKRVQELIDHGFDLDIVKSISDGFELFKKEMVLFIAYTLVVALAVILFSGGTAVFKTLMPTSMGAIITGEVFSQLITQLISPPLMAGFLIAAHKTHRGEQLDFEHFFKGFDYLSQLMTQAVILFCISFLMLIPLGLVFFILGGSGDFDLTDFGTIQIMIIILTAFLILAVYIYIMVSYFFATCFIIFGDLQAWDALETSRQIVGHNFALVLAFGIIIFLVTILGYFICFIGLFATIPIAQISVYCAFKDVLHMDQSINDDDIMDHLVD